jgi:hypothetical protein
VHENQNATASCESASDGLLRKEVRSMAAKKKAPAKKKAAKKKAKK